MSNAKSGGNKKTSSPSDQNYWKRAAASKFNETHRERRIAKHHKRMGLNNTSNARGPLTSIAYPKKSLEKPIERVMFKGDVPEMRTFDEYGNITSYPTFVIKQGVVTDILRVKR
jgi:hypothetical protein